MYVCERSATKYASYNLHILNDFHKITVYYLPDENWQYSKVYSYKSNMLRQKMIDVENGVC